MGRVKDRFILSDINGREVEEAPQYAERYNEGKVDYTLVYPRFLEELSKVMMQGEKKYGRNNWIKLWGDDTNNVVHASIYRHLIAMLKGQVKDDESGLPHAAHLAANAMMLIKYYEDTGDI